MAFSESKRSDQPRAGGDHRTALINDRAICPEVQEHVPDTETIRTRRLAVNTLGDGFIEAVADDTLLSISKEVCRSTHGKICGQALRVPVVEAVGETAAGDLDGKISMPACSLFRGCVPQRNGNHQSPFPN